MSETTTTAIIRTDRAAIEIMPDGSERPITDDEIHVAAMTDPDARPMTHKE